MGGEAGACVGVCLLIVVIGLIIGSFGYVGELQLCLKYHTISRVVEKLEVEKGTYFIGVAQAYQCFPSQRLTLEFAPKPTGEDVEEKDNDEYENGEMPNLGYLKSRTSEGLDLKMDVLVEYQLRPEESSLMGLFNLTGTNFTWWYKDVVTASLMNTASQFRANMFLSKDRQTIADQMLEGIKVRHKQLVPHVSATETEFFITPLSVQLRHVDLPGSYEKSIETIERIKLDKKLLDEKPVEILRNTFSDRTRCSAQLRPGSSFPLSALRFLDRVKLDVAGVEKTIAEDKISWDQDRSTQQIEKRAEVNVAVLQRNVSITQADTGVIIETMTAERERKVMVVNSNRDFALATLVQEEEKTKQTTEHEVAKKKLDQEIVEANAQAEKTLKKAEELAYEIEQEAAAAADAMARVKAAELEEYVKLKTQGKMLNENVLQHVWMSTLKKLNKAKMFLDYRKVPLFLEAAAK